jgi:hypothetical protein
MSSPEPEYQVALSFAGEQRDYVKAVASELNKHGVRVFYDEDDEIGLWGKNPAEELQRVYMTASNVVVMFVWEDYARKSWPIHERRSALARALDERREYILPARFDDTALPGLDPTVSYLPLANRLPAKLAENIMAKLIQLDGKVEPAKPAFRTKDASNDGRSVCRVIVHDNDGRPLPGATVLLVAQNGTADQGKTNAHGVAELRAEVRRAVAVFVAHPEHRAVFNRQHDNGVGVEVTLPTGSGIQSVAGNTGHLPGFGPATKLHRVHPRCRWRAGTWGYVRVQRLGRRLSSAAVPLRGRASHGA